MTKLIIQIPAYNEEQTLGTTLRALPRELPGVDVVEWLVIDDGSSDRTVEVAQTHGADHVIRLARHQGLARAFIAGIEACVSLGADIIVNTDADNQYRADDIGRLIAPVLRHEAEMVIGARPIAQIRHFSLTKKLLQKLGSWVVRLASGTNIPDAPSGFRAYSRNAAMQLRVFNEYTYTLETIIQAGQKNMAITWVPIRTNPDTRPSRLVRSVPSYVFRSLMTIGRIFMTYRPLRFFAVPGITLFLLGVALGVRFLAYYFGGVGGGHVQSLILAALLLGGGFFLGVVGLVVDLISVNRQLLERLDYRMHALENATQPSGDHSQLPRIFTIPVAPTANVGDLLGGHDSHHNAHA
ncbi:MAG: glycosyltransferase family 2 protein [Candidatus Paceibacterota bacterium]